MEFMVIITLACPDPTNACGSPSGWSTCHLTRLITICLSRPIILFQGMLQYTLVYHYTKYIVIHLQGYRSIYLNITTITGEATSAKNKVLELEIQSLFKMVGLHLLYVYLHSRALKQLEKA
jgi:hypothetical protein